MTDTTIVAGRKLVGCTGWTVPREVAPSFAQEGSHLERYAQRFGAVEINSCFYRPHQPKTYARWAASVADGFRFSVKLPRSITHDAGLVGADELLLRFAAEAGALGDKLGCVLVQLPPSQRFDAAIATAFFTLLKQSFGCMIACEARHPTWFGDEATQVLIDAGVTRVIADPAKGQPGPHIATSGDMYVRLHGSPRVYYSSYDGGCITHLAHDLAARAAAGRDVWVIFDNTAAGAAVPNALDLVSAFASLG
jgi:uncharacterized protein YecE (DUF72 family)